MRTVAQNIGPSCTRACSMAVKGTPQQCQPGAETWTMIWRVMEGGRVVYHCSTLCCHRTGAVLRVQRSTGWAKSEITASRLGEMFERPKKQFSECPSLHNNSAHIPTTFPIAYWQRIYGSLVHAMLECTIKEQIKAKWHCGADHITIAGPGGQNSSSST